MAEVRFSRVAVGTDGSATAAEAVKAAAEMARRFGAELILLGVYKEAGGAPPGSDAELQWASNPEARLREILARTEAELSRDGIDCRTLTDEGDPGDALVRLAEACEADVLVIGNKGMHRRVLGSVPNTVTHRAPCSVLVVKTT
jgi:nucleotide-binding universal stress UspA family protein